MKYDIYINDSIGWPISADYVRQQLQACGDSPVHVYISSLGGDVNTALQIRKMLADHGDVTADLQGFVCSAATIIATGAKEIRMGKYSFFMIHQCSSWQDEWGQMNADDIAAVIARLESEKQLLEQIDHVIASIYAQRSGLSLDDIHGMMAEETWMDSATAFSKGFVDTILDDTEHALTDGMRRRIAACGYSLPPVPKGASENGFWKRMRALLAEMFSLRESNDITTNLTYMKKEKELDPAVAQEAQTAMPQEPVPAPATDGSENDGDTLPEGAEEPSSVPADNEVQQLRTAYEEIRAERDSLQARIDAMQKQDGDESDRLEGGEDASPLDTANNARLAYNRIASIL